MKAMDQTLARRSARPARDVTEENIQARLRGNLLMALSNKSGALLLTTATSRSWRSATARSTATCRAGSP
jgi:NH3-dependent NAD+ synthetase